MCACSVPASAVPARGTVPFRPSSVEQRFCSAPASSAQTPKRRKRQTRSDLLRPELRVCVSGSVPPTACVCVCAHLERRLFLASRNTQTLRLCYDFSYCLHFLVRVSTSILLAWPFAKLSYPLLCGWWVGCWMCFLPALCPPADLPPPSPARPGTHSAANTSGQMGEARRRGNLSSVRAKEKVQKESKSVSPAPFASSFPGAAGKSGGVCLVSLFVCVCVDEFFFLVFGKSDPRLCCYPARCPFIFRQHLPGTQELI